MVNILFIAFIFIGGIISYGAFTAKFPAEQRGFGLLDAHSPVMVRVAEFHDLLLVMCFALSIFVVILLAIVMIRFNRKRNPVPAKFTHNTLIEIMWTVVPIIILVAITVPSIKLLYYMDKAVDAEMTLKVVGHQWYWEYQYPDHGDINFDSIMIADEDLKEGQLRLLETDNQVVLPIDTDIRLLFTSADVIHAWALPVLGVKIDTVPGRLNESWVRIDKEGLYRGQCSELCGVNHGFMPIVVRAVSKEEFQRWVESAKEEFSSLENIENPQIALAN